MRNFIFTRRTLSPDSLVSVELIVSNDRGPRDVSFIMAADVPGGTKAHVRFALEREAVVELRDMLSQWLGDG